MLSVRAIKFVESCAVQSYPNSISIVLMNVVVVINCHQGTQLLCSKLAEISLYFRLCY